MGSDIKVDVFEQAYDRTVEIRIKIPMTTYAASLFPNETLRESVIAAFDQFLIQRR